MVKVKLGKCAVCKEIAELTQHEVVEAPKDEQDRIISISICPKCHDNHEKYRNGLKALGIEIDRTKLAKRNWGRTNDEFDDEMTFTDDMDDTSDDKDGR